jgi:hypothetical protein
MNMELAVEIQELVSYLPNLPIDKVGFASSLINQFSRKGTLSPKQTPWVTKLVALAKGEAPAPPEPQQVGDLTGLIQLFKTAGAKLKWPKIRLTINGVPVVLSLAGQRSKAPGSLSIAGDGGWSDRSWYGRVSPEGAFSPSRSLTPAFAADLVPVLERLSTKPLETIQTIGKFYGRCILCNLVLSDERSLAAGFGETCAKNWGLHSEWKQAAK